MATTKQKLTASKLVENGGNMGKAMLEAGYSASMAKNPQKLIQSKGWREFVDEYIPGEELLKVHAQMLKSAKLVKHSFPKDFDDKTIRGIITKVSGAKCLAIAKVEKRKVCYCAIPDYPARLKAIDMAYKIRGVYNTDRQEDERNMKMDMALDRLSSMLPN